MTDKTDTVIWIYSLLLPIVWILDSPRVYQRPFYFYTFSQVITNLFAINLTVFSLAQDEIAWGKRSAERHSVFFSNRRIHKQCCQLTQKLFVASLSIQMEILVWGREIDYDLSCRAVSSISRRITGNRLIIQFNNHTKSICIQLLLSRSFVFG